MKILRPLLTSLVLSLAGIAPGTAATAGSALLPFEAAAPAATPPSLYSFAELYRVTVAGQPFAQASDAQPVDVQPPDVQPRVRVVSESRLADFSFAVSPPREGQRWALVLAGLFACAWVAHRRLASPY
jgi:hypothetical protein